jgi:hypothetical protein
MAYLSRGCLCQLDILTFIFDFLASQGLFEQRVCQNFALLAQKVAHFAATSLGGRQERGFCNNAIFKSRVESENTRSQQRELTICIKEQQTARTLRKTKAKQQQKLQLKFHQNRAVFEHSNALLKLQHACSCNSACHHSSQDSSPAI